MDGANLPVMQDNEKTPWELNKEMFGTDDPELMREMFRAALQGKREGESTFGGYLNSIRTARGLTAAEMASQASVGEQLWSSWESDEELPSKADFMMVMERLGFSKYKKERLLDRLR